MVDIFTTRHPKDDGRLYFQSVHISGGGSQVPVSDLGGGSRSQIWGGGPSLRFLGGTQSQIFRGVPSLRYLGGPSPLFLGGGYPSQ